VKLGLPPFGKSEQDMLEKRLLKRIARPAREEETGNRKIA
jgi:hypothetical protein